MKRIFLLPLACIFAICLLNGQANLSIQGTIQNSSGAALPDGRYELTFRIYSVPSGGVALWTEVQPNVQILGGLYSTILGQITPLTASSFDFTQPYYLGVTLKGGAEIDHRAKLSAAAYSLAVSGNTNLLPSQGSVGIGTRSLSQENQLHVQKTNAPARIFVEGRDTARLVFKADSASATISYYGGNVYIQNLNIIFDEGVNLASGKTITFNGDPDWRLVEYDDFSTSTEGWNHYINFNSIQTSDCGGFRSSFNTPFSKGFQLVSCTSTGILKKEYDLTGIPHSKVKVVFTYHFMDSWEYNSTDGLSLVNRFEFGYAGFSTGIVAQATATNGNFQVGWRAAGPPEVFESYFQGAGYNNNTTPQGPTDSNLRGSMVAETTLDKFWVFFGSNLNESASNENFAISNIEIWVK
jgi:hypothetical protein